MTDDLVKRLRFLASGQNDPHSLAIIEATDRIEELEKMINQDCICDDSVQVIPSVKQKPPAKRLSGRKIKDD